MQPPIRIEVFTPTHQQAVIDLILPIQQVEFRIAITLAQQPDLENIAHYYGKGAGNFWVAVNTEAGSSVVGTIGLLHPGTDYGIIRKMFVHKNYRGKETGVAQQLMDALVAHAQAHALCSLWLGTTSKMRAAHVFYRRNGFAEMANTQLPHGFLRMPVDDKFFTRAL